MRLNLTCKDADVLDQVSTAIQAGVRHAWVTRIAPHARVDLILSSDDDIRVRGPNNTWNDLVFRAMFDRVGHVTREMVPQNEIWFPLERIADIESVLIHTVRAMRPKLSVARFVLAGLMLALASSVVAQPAPTGIVPFKVDLARIAGVNFTSSPYIDVANSAFRVNVVAGAAGGGIAQLQVRSAGNVWTDVGFSGGNQNVPVNCVVGCVAGGSFADAAAFTFGTTPVGLAAFVVDDVAPNTVAENSAGAGRMSTNRIPYFSLHTDAGTALLGQLTMAASIPVTLASNQSALSVTATNSFLLDATFTGRINTQGQKTMAASTPVVLASDHSKILVTPDSVALPANQSVNLNQVAGSAVTTGNGTAAGAQRMSLASDSTGNIATIGTSVTPGTGATNLGKAEDAAVTSGDVGVAILGHRNEGTAQLTSANNDYGMISIDGYGAVFERQDHPNAWYVNTLSTATVLTEIKAVPGAGLSLYVSHIDVTNSVVATATADAMPTLKYGTGTNCGTGTTTFWRCMNSAIFTGCLSAGGNINPPIKLPANNALCFITTPAGTRAWNISGFTAP